MAAPSESAVSLRWFMDDVAAPLTAAVSPSRHSFCIGLFFRHRELRLAR